MSEGEAPSQSRSQPRSNEEGKKIHADTACGAPNPPPPPHDYVNNFEHDDGRRRQAMEREDIEFRVDLARRLVKESSETIEGKKAYARKAIRMAEALKRKKEVRKNPLTNETCSKLKSLLGVEPAPTPTVIVLPAACGSLPSRPYFSFVPPNPKSLKYSTTRVVAPRTSRRRQRLRRWESFRAKRKR